MCLLLCGRPRTFGAVILSLMATVSVSCAQRERAQDPPPLERIATIPLKGVPGKLDHLGADFDHDRLFVANLSNSTLDVVDVKNNKLVKQVAGQKAIHSVAYARDLDRIFVGNGDGVCNALDGRDYSLLKSIPVPRANNVRYDSRSHRVFVAGENRLAVIDGKSLERLDADITRLQERLAAPDPEPKPQPERPS